MTKEDLEPGAQHLIETYFFWKPLLMPPFCHLNNSSGAHPAMPKTPWVSSLYTNLLHLSLCKNILLQRQQSIFVSKICNSTIEKIIICISSNST